jgi:phosphatidylglycerol:prolipoprotein diacylglycerol transferase
MVFELGALILILGLEKVPYKDRRPQFLGRPGAVFYSWLIFHSIGRLIMEHYRDDFRGPSLGLSISSWISLTLIALAIYLMVRKNPNP